MALYRILSRTDFPSGSIRRVEAAGRAIAVFHVDGTIYAIDDACTHEEASLSEGTVAGCRVTCPWHAAEFDLRTGEALTPPAVENVRSYPVVVSGDDVSVEIE